MVFGSRIVMAIVCGTMAALCMGPGYAADYWLPGILVCYVIQWGTETNRKLGSKED